MSKTKEQLLAAYKKAAKPARLVIIGRAGFTSEKEYFDYLDTLDTVPVAKVGSKYIKTPEEKLREKDLLPMPDEKDGMLDMVIAFDTTGSMGSYIAAVRKHVKELIPKLFSDNNNLLMKIVAFGDYCDMNGPDNFGKAYQETDLTNDGDLLIKFVQEAKSTGGGDADEFYELVIKKVTEETPWRKDAKKAVLLIADCGPHAVGYTYGFNVVNNQIDWKKEAQRAAELGIQWDTMNCGNSYVEAFYKPLSSITNGINIPFKSSEKTQEIISAATSVRGSLKSKMAYETAFRCAVDSGDTELIGSYKSLSKLL